MARDLIEGARRLRAQPAAGTRSRLPGPRAAVVILAPEPQVIGSGNGQAQGAARPA